MVDVLIVSVVINALFFVTFIRISSFFSRPGQPNFFNQSVKASFNLIRNPTLVVGATSDRSLNLYIKGENEPIFPSPGKKGGLPLQFSPKNLFHTFKGLPAMFAFENSLSNVNPLEEGNNDIELGLIAQANEYYVQAEVERRVLSQNPIMVMKKLALVQVIIMVVGFIGIGYLLLNFQTELLGFKDQALDAYNTVKPIVDQWISQGAITVNQNLSPGVNQV